MQTQTAIPTAEQATKALGMTVTETREVDAAGFSIGKFKTMETRNGVAWTANIVFGGKVVAEAEQDGNGGATRLYFRDRQGGKSPMADRFAAAADAALPNVGVERAENFVECLINGKDFGCPPFDLTYDWGF